MNIRKIFYPEQDSAELRLNNLGQEKCRPLHSYTAVRSEFLIHFIIDGFGTFTAENKTHKLSKSQAFVIFPGQKNTYCADAEKPWHYYWLGITGSSAAQIIKDCQVDKNNPILDFKDNPLVIRQLMALYYNVVSGEFNKYSILGHLNMLFATLYKKTAQPDPLKRHTDEAVRFIKNNYMHELSVEKIASHLFIDRTYLYRLFIQRFGISPQKYITHYRLKTACKLLDESNLSVTDIALYTGFSYASALNKAFKNAYDLTPKEYRKRKA